MTINENEKDLKWISVGSIKDFVEDKPQKAVDPYFDWFISSLAVNIDNYNLNQYARANLTSFIYLLLNTQFQSKVKKIRDYFDIPSNGFENEEMFNAWRNILYQAIIDYQNKKKIPLKQNKIITFVEKYAIKLTKGKMANSTIFNDLESVFIFILMDLLKIGEEGNGKLWSKFFYHSIITFDPKKIFDELSKFNRENEVLISPTNLSITITLKSTINSIKTTIDENKDKIVQTLEKMRTESPITNIETLDIKRDYFIYCYYTSHKSTKKRGKDIYENTRKELAVEDKAEELLNEAEYAAIEKLDWTSMRKIVSRMKQRTRQSFIDKSDGIGNLLSTIEATEPAPYPEYVAGRSVTR